MEKETNERFSFSSGAVGATGGTEATGGTGVTGVTGSSSASRARATEIVVALGAAEANLSPEQLVPLVYDELRALAQSFLAAERPGHTLQATALVHEAFLRLINQQRVNWKGRAHFFAVGARMMRRVLVDHARKHKSRKRGGVRQRVTFEGLEDPRSAGGLDFEDILSLDTALDRLAELDERQAQVVELRFFAGFGVEETARLLEVSRRTVEGDWTHARVWLLRELNRRR